MDERLTALVCPDCGRERSEAGCQGWMDCMNSMRDQLANLRSRIAQLESVVRELESIKLAFQYLSFNAPTPDQWDRVDNERDLLELARELGWKGEGR